MPSNINPSLEPTKSLVNFRFWCQKVLPLVYDDSLSYYEVLGKMVVQLNDVIDNVNADTENVLTLKDAFLELQTYVNNFFDDIDQLASYAERAETAQTAANRSAINASESAANASASSLTAMNARDAANSARQAAETSANTASTAADHANTKANEAAQSAITAQTAQASASQSATLAATDRSAAQTAASTATTKANEANTSATNAETSAENAAQSETNAEELVNNIQENLDNIQQNTQDISELKESFTQIVVSVPSSVEAISALNTVDGKRVYYNANNNWIETATASNYSFKVFPVESGVTYEAYGYGYDASASFYVGILSTENFVASGNSHTSAGAYKGYLESGTSVYPSGLTYHHITFKSTVNGYLYINYQTNSDTATLSETNKIFAIPEPNSIVRKNGQTYTVLNKQGDVWVKRIFKNSLANNLFQLYEFGYGYISNGKYTETKKVYTATTDIVGPISIGRIINGASENAQWAGGNHTVTINDVAYKTAEQVSLNVYCGGTEITALDDGVYYGEFVAVSVNDIYFAQTITDNAFTNATKAVRETRHYCVDSGMSVSVEIYLYAKMFIAAYYGMQLPTPFITRYYPVGEQIVYAKTDLTSATYFANKTWNIKLKDGSDGWSYDMELSQDGLGNFALTDSEKGYGYFSAGGGKTYYQLIRLQKIESEQGKTFFWQGKYNMYKA